jgi:hypothetical protein
MYCQLIKAINCNYSIIAINPAIRDIAIPVYSLLRDNEGNQNMYLLSPEHGRSYLVGKIDGGKYVISKGNGLSYTQYTFLNTKEMGIDSWGLLLEEDAIRDFKNGMLAASYGILTNRMHYVIRLDNEITINLDNPVTLKPVLLQYDLECPYRLSDTPFIPRNEILKQIEQWSGRFGINASSYYMIAAEVLIRNLRILHDHDYLHNAITTQNYTWALELVDFEMANSQQYPYSDNVSEEEIKILFLREILHTYQLVVYIAGVLHEGVCYGEIDSLFATYGFELSKILVEVKY